MAQIEPGYFQDTYWPGRYWQTGEQYWQEGALIPAEVNFTLPERVTSFTLDTRITSFTLPERKTSFTLPVREDD